MKDAVVVWEGGEAPGPLGPKTRRLAVGKGALRTGISLARWGSFVV